MIDLHHNFEVTKATHGTVAGPATATKRKQLCAAPSPGGRRVPPIVCALETAKVVLRSTKVDLREKNVGVTGNRSPNGDLPSHYRGKSQRESGLVEILIEVPEIFAKHKPERNML